MAGQIGQTGTVMFTILANLPETEHAKILGHVMEANVALERAKNLWIKCVTTPNGR